MKQLRDLYIASLIIAIITLIVIFFYMVALTGLNFKRTRSLTNSDFSLQTNEIASAKFIFTSLFPLFVIMLVPLILFMRIIAISLFDSIELTGDKTEKQNLLNNDNDNNNNNIKNVFEILRIIHIVITFVAIAFLVVSFVLLCIDFGNCNKPNPFGTKSICSDQLICCATDVLTPPGIVDGCPWIQSCAGVTPSFKTNDLNIDPYFLWTFIITIVLLGLMILHLYLGFKNAPIDDNDCNNIKNETDINNELKTSDSEQESKVNPDKEPKNNTDSQAFSSSNSENVNIALKIPNYKQSFPTAFRSYSSNSSLENNNNQKNKDNNNISKNKIVFKPYTNL